MEETKRVQNIISNTMDTSLDLRPPNIQSILDSNPNVSTWAGKDLPHGYLDWLPICVGFNARSRRLTTLRCGVPSTMPSTATN